MTRKRKPLKTDIGRGLRTLVQATAIQTPLNSHPCSIWFPNSSVSSRKQWITSRILLINCTLSYCFFKTWASSHWYNICYMITYCLRRRIWISLQVIILGWSLSNVIELLPNIFIFFSKLSCHQVYRRQNHLQSSMQILDQSACSCNGWWFSRYMAKWSGWHDSCCCWNSGFF